MSDTPPVTDAEPKEEERPAGAPITVEQAPGWVPPIILRNKGVPITLYRLENGALPAVGEDEELPTRKVHLRFNANHVAEIEEAFDGIQARVPIIRREVKKGEDGQDLVGPAGPVFIETVEGYEDRNFYGMEAFQQAMTSKTFGTVRRVIAIALDLEIEEAGLAMIPGETMTYQNAVGIAWSIAQGVDPTDAAKALQKASADVAATRGRLASELQKTTEPVAVSTTVSPGATG